jgi:hypothetical protein
VPFNVEELRKASSSLAEFRARAKSQYHERYSFPFFSGTYFSYRKVDVLRVAAVAKSVSSDPSLLDVGCGYGDFLSKLRAFIPRAEGIEADGSIFYSLGIPKPDYIRIGNAKWINAKYDCIFVGWMEPGQDFRDSVASNTDVIVTTLDQGISLAAEFDGHGFERIASWRTPSWDDVNIEIMNRYYTPSLSDQDRNRLSKMRGAHNLWYVYAKPRLTDSVSSALLDASKRERETAADTYEFEKVLDECGFVYKQKLDLYDELLWKIQFDSTHNI